MAHRSVYAPPDPSWGAPDRAAPKRQQKIAQPRAATHVHLFFRQKSGAVRTVLLRNPLRRPRIFLGSGRALRANLLFYSTFLRSFSLSAFSSKTARSRALLRANEQAPLSWCARPRRAGKTNAAEGSASYLLTYELVFRVPCSEQRLACRLELVARQCMKLRVEHVIFF